MNRPRSPYQQTNLLVKRPVSPDDLLIIFGILVTNPDFFAKVKPNFTPDVLNVQNEEFHASFLKTLYDYFDTYSAIPVQQTMISTLVGLSKEPNSGFHESLVRSEVAVIYGLLNNANPAAIRSTENKAADLIEDLLIERRVISPARSVFINSSDSYLANPGEFLTETTQRFQSIKQMLTRSLISSVPTVKARAHNYVDFDHDLNFMNALTQGGLPRKSVSGVFGVFGGGKTTIATQSAASRINIEWRKEQRGEPSQIVVYANCEGSYEEISFRVISFLAKIPARAVRAHFYDIQPLRDHIPSDPEDYNNRFGLTLPETERLAEALEKVDKYLKIIDLSGGTESSNNLGKGFVNDLVMGVDAYCREAGKGISLFILDYGKSFVRRYMDLNNMAAENIRFYLGRLPDLIRRDIADKFDCAAIVLQQMNKNANTKKPGSLLTHGDSSEASDFGENCWFCFALSAPSKNENGIVTTTINMSKARDVEPPRKMPELEFLPYCQGLKLHDDYRIVNNTIHYEQQRQVIMPNAAAPLRRGSRRNGTTGNVTSADMNPVEGI